MSTETDVQEPVEQQEPGEVSNAEYWAEMFEKLRPLRDAVRKLEEHPWVVTGYVAVILTLKTMAVAHGDAATAGSILGSGGFAGVANVIFLIVLPLATLALFCSATIMAFGVWGARGWKEAWPCLLVVSGLLIPPLILVPGEVLKWIAGLTLVASLLLLWWNTCHRSTPPEDDAAAPEDDAAANKSMGSGGRAEFAIFVLIALIGSPISAAVSDDIWLPAEVFTVDKEHLTGYLLSNENGEATILLDEDRKTIVVPSDAVGERKRCSLPLTGAPAWKLLGSPAKYPECPSP